MYRKFWRNHSYTVRSKWCFKLADSLFSNKFGFYFWTFKNVSKHLILASSKIELCTKTFLLKIEPSIEGMFISKKIHFPKTFSQSTSEFSKITLFRKIFPNRLRRQSEFLFPMLFLCSSYAFPWFPMLPLWFCYAFPMLSLCLWQETFAESFSGKASQLPIPASSKIELLGNINSWAITFSYEGIFLFRECLFCKRLSQSWTHIILNSVKLNQSQNSFSKDFGDNQNSCCNISEQNLIPKCNV